MLSRWRWHLDEVLVKIIGQQHCFWRAVDHEGEVLESFMTAMRCKKAALNFLKRTLKRYGRRKTMATDRLRSYGAATKELGVHDRQKAHRWANKRAEGSHEPFLRRVRTCLTGPRFDLPRNGMDYFSYPVISRYPTPPWLPEMVTGPSQYGTDVAIQASEFSALTVTSMPRPGRTTCHATGTSCPAMV